MADEADAIADLMDAPDVNTDDNKELGEALLDESPSNPEPSTEENKETTTEVDAPTPETDEGKPATEATETEKPSDDTTSEEPEADVNARAEKRKEQLNQEIRELVATRNQKREEIARLNEAKYRTQTVEELVDEGMSAEEARIEQQRQELQLSQQNLRVADLNTNLDIESAQVMSDFPIFDPGTPENPNPLYNAEVASRANALYQQAAGLRTDPETGLIIQANITPYEFYKNFNDVYTQGRTEGENAGKVTGQRAAEKMLAAVEPSSSAPAAQEEDTEDDLFLKGMSRVN